MKKKIITVSLVVLAIIYFLYVYHVPHYIQNTIKGTIYSFDSSYEKQTDISIEGKLYKNLFGKNEYIGTITVDDLKYDIDLKEQDTYYFEVLFANSSNFKLKSIGTVMTSFDFERVWIMLDDINKIYNINDGYVAGPAKSMKEANEIATSILKGKQ